MTAWRKIEMALIDRSGVEFTQEMLEAMRAAPMDEVARVFHEKYDVMESVDAVTAFIDDSMERYYAEEAQAREGADEFVHALRELGIPCCIVSASPQAYLESGMKTIGLDDAFERIISTKETGISKQDPRIFELALETLDARAQAAWGADDSLYAIRVMSECGIQTIGTYENDLAGSFDDLAATATVTVKSFDSLL